MIRLILIFTFFYAYCFADETVLINYPQNSDIIILMTNWKNIKKIKNDFKNMNLKKKIILDHHGLLKSFINKNFKEYFTLEEKIKI